MTGTGFDVREYARTAHGSLRAGLGLERMPAPPAATAELLAALAHLEGATMHWLRSVLVTATHKDAAVTAFLVTWAYEKYWIADALAALAGADMAADAPAGRERGTVLQAMRGMIDGPDIVAAHLACLRRSDHMLEPAYEAVARQPSLVEAVTVIRDVKARHALYLDEQIALRTRASRRAARLVRRELARWPLPIGVETLPAPLRARLASVGAG